MVYFVVVVILYGVTLLPNYGNFMLESTSIFIWLLPTPFDFVFSLSLSHSHILFIIIMQFVPLLHKSKVNFWNNFKHNTKKGRMKSFKAWMYQIFQLWLMDFIILFINKDATRVMMCVQMGNKEKALIMN